MPYCGGEYPIKIMFKTRSFVMRKSLSALFFGAAALGVTVAGCLSLTLLAGCKPQPSVVVATPVGSIGGNEAGTYQTFLGIPYAQAPVGELRWRAPLPMPAFSSVFNATQAGAGCEQFSPVTDVPITNEDCLFLNIWRPSGDNTPNADSKLPVMVYIHGGAFAFGSSTEPHYDGGVLAATRNVIVVSMNYRLGYLGFLALPELTSEAGHSGNYAFFDQQLALQWVHDNIGAFGGDAERVMLFGESAGGMSTCMQLASPKSAAMIHSAAIQSGFCLADVFSQEEGEIAGDKFAANAGCADGDRLACLRSKSIREIDAALKAAGIVEKPFVPSPAVPVVPVLDGEFISSLPRELLAIGAMAGKSVIIGTNKNEGTLFTAFHADIPDEGSYLALLESEYGDNADAVAALYPFGAYSSGLAAYADLSGDRFFTCNAKGTEDALAQGGANVYAYEFVQDVSSPLAGLLKFVAPTLDFGTMHTSDVPYVFGYNSGLGNIDGERAITADLMQTYWVNAATTGEPNAENMPQWPLYDAVSHSYLEIDAAPSVAVDIKAQKCTLLNSLPLISI